jgi:hypothetical protein
VKGKGRRRKGTDRGTHGGGDEVTSSHFLARWKGKGGKGKRKKGELTAA